MPAQKMQKAGFAVSFMIAMLGAVLLLISQVPLKREYYALVATRSFSFNEPMTFYWTFATNGKYRIEVKGGNLTSTPRFGYILAVGNHTYLSDDPRLTDPPWVWDWNQGVTCTNKVTLWCYDYRNGSEVIERATMSASIEISEFRETTFHLTYLIYVGLPLLIIGAILITITGKDVDSPMRMTKLQDTSSR